MTTATPEIVLPYYPRGAAYDIFSAREPEVVISGPAGTGKSRAILEKLHAVAMKYPNARILMLRKTRRSLTESGMVTYWQKIRPDLDRVQWKAAMQQYQYPNGSVIAVGGLDKPSKIMSSEWDIIYCQEATELTENDWEACTIRLRNGKVPYQQMIGDCNPDAPGHWLKQRAVSGKTLMLESRHEDNPLLFSEAGQITSEGERYIGSLEALSGVRLARYRYGIWASAEGAVYEDSWNRAVNVINAFPIPLEWPRYLAVDFGYTHPFVCLWAAQDPDGRLYIYRQVYKTKTLVEDHAKVIKQVSRWGQAGGDPLPRQIICDHDAEDRMTLTRHLGLMTMPAHKGVSDGIQAVASRFRVAGDGKPRVMIMRDCLVERDRELMDMKHPTCLEDEPESYVWDTRQGMKRGDQPVKEFDHACLVSGTMITTLRGEVPIEQIEVGDYALTRNGYKPVKAAGLTAKDAEVYTVSLSNGATLTGTENHPVYLKDIGYIPLHAIRYGDIIEDINLYKERYPLCRESLQQSQRSLSTRELISGVTLMQKTGRRKTTIDQGYMQLRQALRRFIKRYGKMPTALFQRVITSIIKMATPRITHLRIWNAFQSMSTIHIMPPSLLKSRGTGNGNTLRRYVLSRQHGINPKKDGIGIALLALCLGTMQNTMTTVVNIAGKGINPENCRKTTVVFAPMLVNQHGGVMLDSIMRHVYVSNAEESLFATSTLSKPIVQKCAQHGSASLALFLKQGHAQYVEGRSQQGRAVSKNTAQEHAQVVAVCSINKNNTRQDVYNLTVDNAVGEGEYFANGILVHNCDALRYLISQFDVRPTDIHYSNRVY